MKNVQFEEILTKWEESKEYFMLWIKEVCGHQEDSWAYKELDEAIQSKTDIELWIEFFDGSFDSIEETTGEFLKHIRKDLSA